MDYNSGAYCSLDYVSYYFKFQIYIIIIFLCNIIQLGKMQERNKPPIAVRGGQNGSSSTGGDPYSQEAGGAVSRFLYKVEHDIKMGIFQTMYLVVKDSEITLLKFSILLFLEFLQMLQYAFSGNLKSAWKNDDVFYYVSQFLSFTHIEPWMSKVNYGTYLVIFYSCVGVLTLTILSFIYVSIQSTRTKISIQWPQKLLRVICIVTTTVIFLPCLELLNSMLVCELNKENQSVHYIFKDFKCWTGIHIIHAAVAILSSVVYILISLLITLTFYSNMNNPSDASAKSDSRADIQRLIQKIIVVFIFLFLDDEDQQWFIIILYFILSALTLERYFHLRSFHNEIIQLQHNIYRAVCLWSNIAILISKILENTRFNGGFQLFFLGCPLVVGILIFTRDHRREELLYSVSNFQTGEDAARQVKYFLSLIARKENGDRSAEILLNGFIYLHEDSCPNQQCHLKIYKKNVVLQLQNIGKKTKTSASIHKHMALVQKQDNYQLLLQHAKNMYRLGLQKFPTCPALRIHYAYFLLDKLNKKQEALSELNQAFNLRPTFDEQFVIYRNKKFIEECFEEQQIKGQTQQQGTGNVNAAGGNDNKQNANQNAVDMMTRFAFENTFRQLSQQIERCAEFHMEFWNTLQNDRPDLGKLGDCGSKINTSIEQVDQLWFELNKINANAPKAMKLYGRYQIDILQDKETGQDLLQRAKEAANMKQNFLLGGSDSINDILQVSSDGTPCIFVSGDPDRMGYVTQCNSGAVRVFGYQAYEMKNQKVEKLMPDLYGKNHSKILEEALAKGPENIPNKERLVFAKHKSGYIFPVWLQLKLIQSLSNEISFIALFKIDKKMMSSNVGFVLINKDNKIQAMSSSCMKLMNLDINWIRKVQQQGYDIQRLAPDMETRKDEIASSKAGIVVDWNIPYFQKKKWINKASDAVEQYNNNSNSKKKKSQAVVSSGTKRAQESNVQVNRKIFKFLCNVGPIIMGSLGEIGHYIRLDVIKNDNPLNQVKQERRQGKDSLRQPQFQFRFDYYSGRFIREVKDPQVSSQNSLINKNPWFLAEANNYQTADDSNDEDGAAKPLLKNQLLSSDTSTDDPLGTTQDQLNPQQDVASQSPVLLSGDQTQTQIQHFEDLFHRKKKWAKGIEIYALRDGRVQHKGQIDEEKRMIELEEMRRRKQEEEERNFQELANFTNNIKSKKALKNALNNSHQSSAIRNLRMTMNIVILFLLALAISEFVVISDQFKEINENFGMLQRSYLRISEIQRVAYDIRSLILINEGRLINYQDYQKISAQNPDFRDYLKRDIEKALNSIYELQDYMSLSTMRLSEDHQQMIDSKMIPLYFLEQSQQNMKVINFTLTESVLQMSSAIFTVRHLPFNRFNETQEDIFFVMYNSFNDFYLALLKSSEFLEQELYVRAKEKTNLLLTLFIASVCIIILSIPILFPAVDSVNKTKERILLLFIEIPNSFIAEMTLRCDQFLASFSSSDDKQGDDVKSEDGGASQKEGGGAIDNHRKYGILGERSIFDENQQKQVNANGNSSDSFGKSSKRQIAKQPKNSSNTSINFFFQFSFAVLVIIAYFTSMFYLARTYLSEISVITDELSLVAFNEAHFTYMQNVQREMIYNKNKKVENRNSFNVSQEILGTIYDEVQKYVEAHQANRGSIMNQDLCSQPEYFNMALIPQECSTLFNNASIHGLQSILIVYFELLREQLTTYQRMINQLPKNQTFLSKNQTDALLNSGTFKNLYWLQFRFLQDAFRALITTLKTTTSADFENLVNTKMALFIVFMILVLLSYLIIWFPFVSFITKDIWRTRMMLTIVPIHIIMKIPKMQEFLNRQITGRHGGAAAAVEGTLGKEQKKKGENGADTGQK